MCCYKPWPLLGALRLLQVFFLVLYQHISQQSCITYNILHYEKCSLLFSSAALITYLLPHQVCWCCFSGVVCISFFYFIKRCCVNTNAMEAHSVPGLVTISQPKLPHSVVVVKQWSGENNAKCHLEKNRIGFFQRYAAHLCG